MSHPDDESEEDVLGEIDNVLNGLTSAAHTRELRARMETYREQLAAWSVSPPTDAQRAALGELLNALRAKVLATARGERGA